mgnify:CR=1 FL=1
MKSRGGCGAAGCGAGVSNGPCASLFNKGTRHTDVYFGFRWAQLQEGIAIVGRGLEVAAEDRLGIGREHRHVGAALEPHEQRLVVGDQLREQREDEQDQEDPERPVAAAVGLEVLPAAAIERRNRERMARDRDRRA